MTKIRFIILGFILFSFTSANLFAQSDILKNAVTAYDNENYEISLDNYIKYIGDNPADGISWYRLGYSYENLYGLDIICKMIFSIANYELLEDANTIEHKYVSYSTSKMGPKLVDSDIDSAITAVLKSLKYHSTDRKYSIFNFSYYRSVIIGLYIFLFILVFLICLFEKKKIKTIIILSVLSPITIIFIILKYGLRILLFFLKNLLGIGTSNSKKSSANTKKNTSTKTSGVSKTVDVKPRGGARVGILDYKPNGEIIGRDRIGKSLAIYRPKQDETRDMSGKFLFKGNNVEQVIWENARNKGWYKP